MDPKTLEFIITISATIIGLLFTINVFFLKRLVNQVDNLAKYISEINVTVFTNNTKLEMMNTGCKERHENIHEQLINHEKRIKTLERA